MAVDERWSGSRVIPMPPRHATLAPVGGSGTAVNHSRWLEESPQAPGPAGDEARTSSEPHRDRRALPRNVFVKQLQHERRRAERSGSPLTLIRYELGSAGNPNLHQVEQLLEVLQRSKRETDLVGHIDAGQVAVLCPDTCAQGSRTLVRKINERLKAAPFKAEVATYPHDLFESIVKQSEPPPAIQPFIGPDEERAPGAYVGKRALDIALALLALALLWPLMLLVAGAVAIDSPGPVLFRQQRLGRQARAFTFYKFRSMVANGDDAIHRRYVSQLIQGQVQAGDGRWRWRRRQTHDLQDAGRPAHHPHRPADPQDQPG